MTVEALIDTTSAVITQEETLKYRKEVLLQAIEKGNLREANNALDSFDDKLNLTPVKVTQQLSISAKTDYKQLLKGTGSTGNTQPAQLETKQPRQIQEGDGDED